jgi:predicted nucleic acid-binding protein
LGRRVRALFEATAGTTAGIGSVLLLPEVLAKPMRDGATDEVGALIGLLSRLELRPVDPATAEVATSLAASHRLRAADAVHLATAVMAGADRFITDNRRDFPAAISEIDITYPDALGDP